MKALKAGYTSVMIDGSKLDYEGNIEVSKKVADVAASMGIPCEAELGKVGGKEDDLVAVADTNTDPQEAREFVERTGVTSLAVAIGTAHGLYKGDPILDFDRLIEIRKKVDIPLVLHGASDVPDELVKKAIKLGICKVNVATDLKIPFSNAVKKYFKENPEMVHEEKTRIESLIKEGSINPIEFKNNLKKLMWEKVGIVRDEKNLNEALRQLQEMEKELNNLKVENKAQYNTELVTALEVINMVEIAILVVKSAILRRESRGAHFRSDFPESNDAWKRSIVLNKNKIKFEAR